MSRQRRRHRPGRVLRIATLAGLVTTLVSGPLTATAAPPEITAIREIRTAVVMLDYPGAPYGNPEQRRTELADAHFGTESSLAQYIREASDGRVTFVPLPGQPKVFGSFPVDAERTCDTYRIRNHAVAALAARGIPKTSYHAISVHIKRPYTCGWGAVGWQWDHLKNTVYGEGAGKFVLVHEFGHTFGLDHLNSIRCTNTLANCVLNNGYKGSTPMGGAKTGYAAPELRKLGWFAPSQLVASPAPGTYTLKPLHAPLSVAGTRILEIPRTGDGAWDRLFIAYRAPGTIDTATVGVQLHRSRGKPNVGIPYKVFEMIDPSPESTGKDNTDLAVGKTITDPFSGIKITTVSADASGAVVRITAI